MFRLKQLLVLVVGLLIARPAFAFEHLDVPLGHWSYEFLERLEVRGAVPRTFLDLRPITRGEAATMVRGLTDGARRGAWRPTPIESQQIDMLRAEFAAELTAAGDTTAVLGRAYHLWTGTGWRLQAFWEGGQRFEKHGGSADRDVTAHTTLEPAAALALFDGRLLAFEHVAYRVRTGDASLAQSTDVRDGEAQFVFDPSDRFAITRTVEPGVRFESGRWRLDLARMRLRWGPGRSNAMLLQDATPPFDLLRLQMRLGPVRFTSLAGQLRAARLLPGDPELRERYLAAHRLEIEPHPRLRLAVSEALIYGNRGLDLSYVNPLTVLFVTQANNGDLDNALASVDGRWRIASGGELYGECVIDDLNLRRGWRNYGNKLGVLAGARWLAPFGLGDWDVEAEWSWASQFTYTHVHPIDRYQHFGGTLGSRTGPDSDLWDVALRRRLSRGFEARLFYELERHGEGGLAVDHDQRVSDNVGYLSGVVESRSQPGIAIAYHGLRSIEFGLDVRALTIRHAGHSATAPSRTSPAVLVTTRLEL